jgi:hypothetical protein
MTRTHPAIVAAALACSSAAALARAQWTVTLMHPPGAAQSAILGFGSGQPTGYIQVGSATRAALWQELGPSVIDLDPGLGAPSLASGAGGGQQVGATANAASLWLGSAQTWINLAPTSAYASSAAATDGVHQVGWTTTAADEPRHAAIWNGTSQSWIDLNPDGSLFSIASAVDGDEQGGMSFIDGVYRASLWHGSAHSWINLNPPGAHHSSVAGIDAGQQVGAVTGSNFYQHAALWRGSAGTFIDLHPPAPELSTSGSSANAVHNGMQAGVVAVQGFNHASFWVSSPTSWVDLHQFTTPGVYQTTVATSIWSDAIHIYVGGYGLTPPDPQTQAQQSVALLWTRPACCTADFDCSDTVNTQDIFEYLTAWFAGEPRADLDGDGLSVLDLFAFLEAWFGGCP